MVDYYKLRGYGPEYSIDHRLSNKIHGWNGYKKRLVLTNKKIRTRTNRIVKSRKFDSNNPRSDLLKAKAGDIVYTCEFVVYKNTLKNNKRYYGKKRIIIPHLIEEIEDCHISFRKSIFISSRDYCSYIWTRELEFLNGKWRIIGNRRKRKIPIENISGISGPKFLNYDVYLTPEEAMGSSYGKK